MQRTERLIAVPAAVGEAIAFHGLVAASVSPRMPCAYLSGASVPDFSANGAIRPASLWLHSLSLPDAWTCNVEAFEHPCARPGGSLFP